MIKFFQKLKAKKGFTLVELIVVIAIIGVLAAILVPTMLGYVTSSRVTSANSTAASIKNNVDAFLTTADTAGYGMLLSDGAVAVLSMSVANHQWTINVATAFSTESEGTTGSNAFKKSAMWPATGTATTDSGTKAEADTATETLAYELKGLFPEIETGAIEVYLQGGKALYCWYTAEASTPGDVFTTEAISADDFGAGSFPWDGQTQGISDTGYIVGTAPALTIGEGS